jgi:1,2-phenylacetyl-CoA epoxidase PaaB subunit
LEIENCKIYTVGVKKSSKKLLKIHEVMELMRKVGTGTG